MKKVKEKIERYLKQQFPKKMILKAGRKDINNDTEEIYGYMGVVISVYPKDDKIYYKLNKHKNL